MGRVVGGDAVMAAVTPTSQTTGMTCDECADHPRIHRPYEHDGIPSVSELAGISDDGAFDGVAFAAGRISAEYMLNYGMTQVLEGTKTDKQVILTASRVPKAQWTTDSDLGTYTHEALEFYATGRKWTGPTDLYEWDDERLNLFVDHAVGWYTERRPIVLATEFVVSNPELGYVGTADMLYRDRITGEVVLEDTKTTRERKKSITTKFDKWQKQQLLLANATHVRHYHGAHLVAEIPWEDAGLPRPSRGVVLSIDPSGWKEYDVPIEPDPALLMALTIVKGFKNGVSERKVAPAPPSRPAAPVSVDAMLS